MKKLAMEGKINSGAAKVNTVSIDINAPVDQIWQILMNVKKWKSWNPVIKDALSSDILNQGDNFAWNTGKWTKGKKVHSVVLYMDSNKKTAWFSATPLYSSIMVWEFQRVSKNETRVTLSESRDGFFMNFLSSKNHREQLMEWLNNLKNRAEVVIM